MASDVSLRLGDLAHRFLQEWDFTSDPQGFRDSLRPFLQKWLPPEVDFRPPLDRELEEICTVFFSSEIYRELCSSRILGRELPLLLPWNGQVMEGVIDLLYERKGHLYLADYKTDRIEKENLSQARETYRHQVQIYSKAARQSLRRKVTGFKLIFLRLGAALELKPD